jgi:hypothetical protein
MYGNPQRLYVLEAPDGIVKAGITSRTGDERIQQHARAVKVLRHVVTGYVTGIEAERELLTRLGRIGAVLRGREWFTGIAFSQAAEIAGQVAQEFVNTKPASRAHLLRTDRSGLSFNDRELAILDAYCAKFGLARSVACRKLLFEVGGGIAAH